MKTFNGLQALILARENLPNVGWIFVPKGFDRTSATALVNATFYVEENDADEIYGLKHYKNWLESPTFVDIMEVREKRTKKLTTEEVAQAAIYYLENDDFMD
jgi:hypothetical protein